MPSSGSAWPGSTPKVSATPSIRRPSRRLARRTRAFAAPSGWSRGSSSTSRPRTSIQSVYGAGSADRARIYAEKKVRVAERDAAYDALQQAMNLPINDPTRRAAEQRYKEALAQADRVHEQYEYLPEEIDARRHGQTVAVAVQQLIRTLQTARTGARDAYARSPDGGGGRAPTPAPGHPRAEKSRT